jgi:hypothetical protein
MVVQLPITPKPGQEGTPGERRELLENVFCV